MTTQRCMHAERQPNFQSTKTRVRVYFSSKRKSLGFSSVRHSTGLLQKLWQDFKTSNLLQIYLWQTPTLCIWRTRILKITVKHWSLTHSCRTWKTCKAKNGLRTLTQDLYLSLRLTAMETSCPRKVWLLKAYICCRCLAPWWKLRLRSKRSAPGCKPFSISSKLKESLQTMTRNPVFIYLRNQQKNLITQCLTSICCRQSFNSTKRFSQIMLLKFQCPTCAISSWNECSLQQTLIRYIMRWLH